MVAGADGETAAAKPEARVVGGVVGADRDDRRLRGDDHLLECRPDRADAQPREADQGVALAHSVEKAGVERRRSYSEKILPGFMMFFGSSARLIRRISSIEPSPASSTRKPILCSPMPCSPVQVPSSPEMSLPKERLDSQGEGL